MALAAFLGELLETGRTHVAAPGADLEDAPTEADELLAAIERDYRRDLPGEAPAFSLPAARWGATTLLRACQCLSFRDLDEAQTAAAFATDCPEPSNPATHYSVDLTLRFLPDVARLARGANPSDPLVEQLRVFGGQWPLSSVGMPGVVPASIAAVVEHPCLLALYVDRVIAAVDVSRLSDPRVTMAVRAAIGWHDELAPAVAAALRVQDTEGAHL
jgi:hypothetical protein